MESEPDISLLWYFHKRRTDLRTWVRLGFSGFWIERFYLAGPGSTVPLALCRMSVENIVGFCEGSN